MEEKKREDEVIGLQGVKLALVVLAGCVLVLSTCYNVYVLRQNNELNKMFAKVTFELEQMRYERELMNSFVKEIEVYAEKHPDVQEIMVKYRVERRGAIPDPRAEK